MTHFTAYALHNFRARYEFELSFTKGERLRVLENHGNGWLHSESPAGAKGIVPENYVTTDFHVFSALHTFQPTRTYELSFDKGQQVVVFNSDPDKEWWEGCAGGKCGLFPRSFVSPVASERVRARERSRSRDQGDDSGSLAVEKKPSSRSRSRPRRRGERDRSRSPAPRAPRPPSFQGSIRPGDHQLASGDRSGGPPPPPSRPPKAGVPPSPPAIAKPTLLTKHPAPNLYHSASVGALQAPPKIPPRVPASASTRAITTTPVAYSRRGNSDDVRMLQSLSRKHREESQRLPSNPAFQQSLQESEPRRPDRSARRRGVRAGNGGDEFGVDGSITDEERAAESREDGLGSRKLAVKKTTHSRSRSTGRASRRPLSNSAIQQESAVDKGPTEPARPAADALDVENTRLKAEVTRLLQRVESLEEQCQSLRVDLESCSGACRRSATSRHESSTSQAGADRALGNGGRADHQSQGDADRDRRHWIDLEPPPPAPPTHFKYPPELNGYLSSPPATQPSRPSRDQDTRQRPQRI